MKSRTKILIKTCLMAACACLACSCAGGDSSSAEMTELEQKLQQSDDKFYALTHFLNENIDQGIVFVSMDGKIQEANQKYLDIIGYTLEEAKALTYQQITPEEWCETEDILRESLFGENPAARTLLAFAGDKPAAYVVYFFTFGTMLGKRGLWLDDIFVHPDFRQKGIATALMAYLADIAVKNDCARFEWVVLDWNQRAFDFYEGLGAEKLDDWRACRLEGDKIAVLAGRLMKAGGGE